MQKSLFDFLLEKQRQKTINSVERKVMSLYLQVEVLRQYFTIAVNYCKTNKIQKEVVELHPSWTGYENYYWFTYHYEAFGNALYSFKEAITSILKLISGQETVGTKDFLKSDFTQKSIIDSQSLRSFLDEFIKNEPIDKILKDRGDTVHKFGQWRSEISEELRTQNWNSAETKIVDHITKAHERLKLFDTKIINFINEKLQQE